jgi:hypothetical protein
VEGLVVYTLGTDPDHLLGRAQVYVTAARHRRGRHGSRQGEAHTEGLALLRISCGVPPAEATAYDVAVHQQVVGGQGLPGSAEADPAQRPNA